MTLPTISVTQDTIRVQPTGFSVPQYANYKALRAELSGQLHYVLQGIRQTNNSFFEKIQGTIETRHECFAIYAEQDAGGKFTITVNRSSKKQGNIFSTFWGQITHFFSAPARTKEIRQAVDGILNPKSLNRNRHQ